MCRSTAGVVRECHQPISIFHLPSLPHSLTHSSLTPPTQNILHRSSLTMAEAKHQEQDKSCEVCGVGDVDEACMLLCDGVGCEREFHTYCLTPSLHHIPPGDWYCPLCSEEGRAEELRRHFEEHEGMKKKMKTRKTKPTLRMKTKNFQTMKKIQISKKSLS